MSGGFKPTTASPVQWYVRHGGRSHGPYSEARLRGFFEEGRLHKSSLIATQVDGPFYHAGDEVTFFGGPESPAQSAEMLRHDMGDEGVDDLHEHFAHTPGSSGQRPPMRRSPQQGLHEMLVMVWGPLPNIDAFQIALNEAGENIAIAGSAWMVATTARAPALRNHLSRALTASQRLIVVESSAESTAWFNLDRDTDLALRALRERVGS